MPRPSEVVKKFHSEYEKSPEDATGYFYKLSQDSNYIRRITASVKDLKWITKDRVWGSRYHGKPLQTGEKIRRRSPLRRT